MPVSRIEIAEIVRVFRGALMETVRNVVRVAGGRCDRARPEELVRVGGDGRVGPRGGLEERRGRAEELVEDLLRVVRHCCGNPRNIVEFRCGSKGRGIERSVVFKGYWSS